MAPRNHRYRGCRPNQVKRRCFRFRTWRDHGQMKIAVSISQTAESRPRKPIDFVDWAHSVFIRAGTLASGMHPQVRPLSIRTRGHAVTRRCSMQPNCCQSKRCRRLFGKRKSIGAARRATPYRDARYIISILLTEINSSNVDI